MSTLQRNQKGFTLLEGLIVVAILGILAVMAVTMYTGLVARSSLDTFTNNLNNAVRLAKTRAVGDMDSFMVCPSSDGSTCADGVAAYANGILVVRRTVTPATTAGAQPTTGTGEVIKFVEGVRKIRVESLGGSTEDRIVFIRNGQPSPTFSGMSMRVGYYDSANATKAFRQQVVCISGTGIFTVAPNDCPS